MNREKQWVAWFKELFAARTPAKNILDAHPSYRVTWTEIAAKARELGYTDAVNTRLEWADIFRRYGLRAWCQKTIDAAGEDLKMPRHKKPVGM